MPLTWSSFHFITRGQIIQTEDVIPTRGTYQSQVWLIEASMDGETLQDVQKESNCPSGRELTRRSAVARGRACEHLKQSR
jgi:hypothetical protein